MHVGGFAPVKATEFSDVRETRTTNDAAAESFAGVLSNAMQPHAPAPAPAKPKEGTSELEHAHAPEENDSAKSVKEDEESTVEKPSRKHTRRAHPGTNADVVKSLDALDPTLQDKLARVIARMQDETGLDVSVEETYRTQARQDTLYAQGRDTTGPVVTWTRNSQHTAGRAVDVTLSGGTGPIAADAYTTLQRIANEEGLHTLGARDPGHLELPSTTPVTKPAIDLKSLIPSEPADASGSGTREVPIAQVAQLAKVADVAAVAQPAQVARVATVGHANGPSATTTNSPENAGTVSRDGVQPSNANAVSDVVGASSNGGAQQRAGRDRGQSGSSGGDARGYSAMAAAVALRNQAAGGGLNAFSLSNVAGASGPNAAERVARVIEAMEDAPARPLSQITMNVDAGNGTSDRIQLSMRGASLNATIDTADARAAQAMNGRADELVRALTRDGIDLQSLHVRSSATAVAGSLATSSSQTSSDSSTSSQFERGQPWLQHERQRSQQERRNSQRDKRGGQEQ